VKRILAYPIDVHASVVILPDAPPSNGDSGGDDSREDGSSRQRRRFSAPLLPPFASGLADGRETGSGALGRTPAQESGGPSLKAVAASVVSKELCAATQASMTIDDVRVPLSDSHQCTVSPAKNNEEVEMVGS